MLSYDTAIYNYILNIINGDIKSQWNKEKTDKLREWNYIDNCMISALLEYYKATNAKKALEFCDKFLSSIISEDGDIQGYKESDYNLDNISGGCNLILLYEYTNNPKYKKAIDQLDNQLKNQPRTKENNYIHKAIYPNQIWLDGLYMAQIYAIMRLNNKYLNGELSTTTINNQTQTNSQTQYDIDELSHDEQLQQDYNGVINQFMAVMRLMRDKITGLYFHGYDSSREIFWADKITGLSKNFWGRSNGWLAMALVDIIEIMPNFIKDKPLLVTQLKCLLDSVLAFSDKGMIYQVIDKADIINNYQETSASLSIAYACVKACRLGIRPRGLYEGLMTYDSVCKNHITLDVHNQMQLNNICLVAGLGPRDNKTRDGTIEYYLSEPIVSNDAKGLMPLIKLWIEIGKQERIYRD